MQERRQQTQTQTVQSLKAVQVQYLLFGFRLKNVTILKG